MAKSSDTGGAEQIEDRLEKAPEEGGGAEVQETVDRQQELGFAPMAGSDEEIERNLAENEALSLPNPGPLKEG